MKKRLLMTLALASMLVFSVGNVRGQSRDSWTETFDDQNSNTYNNTSYVISGRTWTCKDAGNFSYGNTTMGSPAFVINDDKAGAHITSPVLNTCGNVSFKYAYKSGNSDNVFILQKSTDGINFTDIDTHVLGASSNENYVDYSYTLNEASTTIYIRILSDNQNAHLFIDNYTVTNFSGGNIPPSITNISHSPVLPNATDAVSVSADITDSDGTIAGAELHWGTVSGNLTNSIDMSVSSGNTYTSDSDIPAQTSGATIYYEIYALDDEAGETTSPEQSYQVLTDEPSAHVTSFMATANSATEITLSWTDADASGYLIKGSTSSLGSIVAPVDGTPEANDALVQNVASGTQTHQFTSLTPATTYYFKIYPYNGTDGTINYKTDGSVPEATATTDAAPTAPNVFISEYLEGSSNNKAIEIVNATSGTIDLSDYAVKLASNGGDWGNSIVLSGSLDQGKVYVIGNASAVTTIKDRFDVTSTVTYFNGDDAVGLFYQNVLIDAIGVQGVDPGSSWDVAGVSGGTVDHTLVRKLSVTTGNTNWAASAGTNATDSEWIVFDQDHFYNLGVFGSGWTGLTDNAWETIANWDVQIPDATVNVLINAFANNMPTISSSANCKDLTIESTASGDASILGDNNLTINGTVSVERYITGGVWHDLSASTQNQTVNNLFFDHNPDVWLKSYNEPDNSRTNITSLSAPLSSGAGFEIWVETGNNVTVSFDGSLKTANVTLTTSSTPPLSYSGAEPLGYNLIGNPFASPLDWDEGTWALSNMTDGIWVWNGSTYLDWVGGVGSLTNGIIPMGQGFFVQTTSAAASITIPMDARVHSTQSYYKGAASTPDHMWIKAIKGEKNDQLTIVFADDATEGYDNGRDARKMMAFSGNAPQIYALEQDEKFSVDGLPTLTEAGRTVSVMYHVGESGEQRLLANLESLPEATVVLEDKLTGAVQDLNENPEYIFEAEQGDDPERFALYFNPTPTTLNELNNNADLHVYAFKNELYIRSTGDAANTSKSVWVYDMYGRIILNTIIPPSTLTQLPLDVKNAPVIVKVAGSGSVVTTKVVIN